MFFLIYGEDNYRSRKALSSAKAQFQEKRDASGFNVIKLKSEDGIIRAQEELFSSPFLAEKKLIILEGFCGLPKKDQEQMVENMGHKPESTVAIFFEEEGGKKLAKSPLFELLKKQKFTKEHRPMSAPEASRFAIKEASSEGVKFETPALRRLMEAVGSDPWRIHHETRKLAARASGQGKKTITADDVEDMVSGSKEESVFAYIDACTDGHGTKAMVALDTLMTSGEAELQIIAMLQRHFKIITMARDLMARGINQQTAVSSLESIPLPPKRLGQRPENTIHDSWDGAYVSWLKWKRT